MRIAIPAVAAILLMSATAFADQAEGTIKSVDEEKLTITLENGETYKLPGEVDMAGIEPGIDIVIAFDTINGVKQITDMAVFE